MTFTDFNIEIKRTAGQVKTKCPKCSHDRKKKTDPCLSVNIDEGVWNCHNCGWTGGLKKQNKYMQEIKYVLPVNKPEKEYSDKFIAWFKSRGISKNTILKNRIAEGKEYMPQIGKEVTTIQFKYYRDSSLINIKYRDAAKNFKLVKDAERIMYGLDHLIGKKQAIIVEGEMDKLAFYEAGFENCVSVPNGASNLKMEYLNDFATNFDKVFLAVDNDEPGLKLQEELSRRIGRDICYRVNYFENCKDINDVLINHGVSGVKSCIDKAQLYPLEGVLNVKDFDIDIDSLFEIGLNKGQTVNHNNFDNLFSFASSQLTVVTGIPTHGKSNFLEHICMRLSTLHKWKFGVFSPEHYPMQLHFSVLAEKLIGKSFRNNTKYERMSKSELHIAKEFISDYYHWIRPDGDVYTIDAILNSAKQLIRRHGINALIIDPYNKIDANIGSQNETNYINKFLTKLTIFKQKYDIHIFLVAHPRKMQKKDNGLYEIPTLYDVAGSANFYNQVDNGISVYRDFKNQLTSVYVQKVKFRHIGELGEAQFKYNIQNGRYVEVGEHLDNQSYIEVEQQSML
jgi:twinkle protein